MSGASADPATEDVAEAPAGDVLASDRSFDDHAALISMSDAHVPVLPSRPDLRPGEELDVRDEAAKAFDGPEAWVNSTDAHSGRLSPEDATDSGHETEVRNRPRQIVYVGMSPQPRGAPAELRARPSRAIRWGRSCRWAAKPARSGKHRRIAAVLLATAWQTLPVSAVVGPSREASADLARSLVMVLQRRGPEAGFCTGIVVGPRAVLTAAHCVPPGADLRVHFKGEDSAPVLLPVAGVLRHPGYRADAIARRVRSIDLALVTLEAPLPDRFRPATLSGQSSAVAGEAFTIAGYGLGREGEAATSGRLRAAELSARAPLSAFLLWAEDPAHRGAGACTGDSGGPVLDASGAVAALTLWSTGTGAHRCGALTQALWLAPYRDWIAAAVR